MKRQKITLIVLVIVMIAVVAGYLGIKAYNKKQAEGKPLIGTYEVFKAPSNTIARIDGDSALGTMSVTHDGSNWVLTESPETKTDKSRVLQLVANLVSITADEKVEDISDLSTYGLEYPQLTITVTMTDGTQHTIEFGSYNSYYSGYYTRVDKSDDIYIVSKAVFSTSFVSDKSLTATE